MIRDQMATNEAIFVSLLNLELFIPFAQSLKEKRSVVRSLKDRLRAHFNLSVAEYGYQDKWQRAVIAICMVNGDKHKLESDILRVRKLCEEIPDIEIADIRQEWL